jgi:hypothetical protein
MDSIYGKHEKALTACRIKNEDVRGRDHTTNKKDQICVCLMLEHILLTYDKVY